MIRSGGQAGFTLMETLVAIMLLAISLTMIMQLFSGSLRSGKLAGDYERAVYYARAKMNEILLNDTLSDQQLTGDFDNGYHWSATVALFVDEDEADAADAAETTPTENSAAALFEVTVTVFWPQDDKEKKFSIATLTMAQNDDAALE